MVTHAIGIIMLPNYCIIIFLHPMFHCSFCHHAGHVKVRRPVADGESVIKQSDETQQSRGPCGIITHEPEEEFLV